MPVETSEVKYLRFVLHGETDGILMSRKRPASLALPVPEPKEIKHLLRIFVNRGVRKIRLTGDDPALREDLPELITMVAGLDHLQEVAVTTRGMGLVDRIDDLAERGLHAINFNLDTLKASRYRSMTGQAGFKDVWAALEKALQKNLRVKINTVIQRGVNDDEIADFIRLTKKEPIGVRILEWNTQTDVIAPPERFLSTRESMAAVKPTMIPRAPRPIDGPALVYEIPGHRGTLGFIPNITEHFCPTCSRVGLTDLGEMMSCVFGRGLGLLRYLRAPSGTANATAFIDRVLRRKEVLATKMAGIGMLLTADTMSTRNSETVSQTATPVAVH